MATICLEEKKAKEKERDEKIAFTNSRTDKKFLRERKGDHKVEKKKLMRSLKTSRGSTKRQAASDHKNSAVSIISKTLVMTDP